MEPTVIRGDKIDLYNGGEGVLATVIIDNATCGAKNLALGHISFGSGSSVPPHTREVEEFIYVIGGTATILSCGQKYILRVGDAIYIPPGTEHQHINEHPETLRQLYIFSPPGPENGVRQWPAASDANLR